MKRSITHLFKILFALLIMGWSGSIFAQGYSGGSGTIGDPYQIRTLDSLRYLSETPGDWALYFIQTANIDASATSTWNSGAGFSPIGNSTVLFSGGYDGQDSTISGLYINRPLEDNVGLFGYTDFGMSVKNIRLLNVSITGQNNVGAIGGSVYQADNCSSTGTVSGGTMVGGLVGLVGFSNNSYSGCAVSGTSQVGGFAGYNLGGIMNCYSTGSVSGTNEIGGFVGYNDASVIQFCYAIGLVSGTTDVGGLVGYNNSGSADDCFWNTQTSGQATSAGGTGKTTAEMKRVSTYLSDPSLFLPWDFILADNIWGFNGTDNNGYPFLRYEGYTPEYVWLGNASQDWNDVSNWSEGALPASGNKVFITDVLNDPILNSLAEMTDMTIEPGGSLNLTSTGRLTVTGVLKNEAGNAGLVLDPDASLVNGTASVAGSVKREIANDGSWHFLSCPINQVTMPAICDGNFAPLTGDFNSVTGATYDFFYWQEPPATANLNWINLKNADWNPNTADFGDPPRFVTGKGYLVEYGSLFTGDAMKTFVGTLGQGGISIPVTNTSGGTWSGFNLIGNNYPSSIDWNAATGWGRTPLEDNGGGKDFWIWNNAAANYGVYNSALGEIGGPNGVSQYIPPTQAFFVKASANGNVTMDDQVRCHSTQAWLKSDDNTLRIGVTSTLNTYSDEVLLAFNSIANGGSDKLFSLYEEAPSLYLPVDNNDYSIRFLDDVSANPSIPLSFKSGKDGNYTINLTGTAKFSNVFLQDLKTGATQDVKIQPAYAFTSSIADDANRFLIRFTPLGIDPNQPGQNNIFVYDNVLNVNNPGESVVTVYNMMGSKILEKQTNNESLYQLSLQIPTGYYLVKVTNDRVVYSQKVFVK